MMGSSTRSSGSSTPTPTPTPNPTHTMPTTHPWSLVPAADYEAHFGPEGAGLLAAFGGVFGRVYAARRPRRVALLALRTGAGLQHIDPSMTSRVVGLDVNLSFLAVARQRFLELGTRLELFCADAESAELEPGAFDLVHAAHALEYLDLRVVGPRIASWLAPGGACSVVLQMGSLCEAEAGAPATLRGAATAGRLVTPEEVSGALGAEGLVERRTFELALQGGRRLFAGLWERPASGPAST